MINAISAADINTSDVVRVEEIKLATHFLLVT